MSIRINNSNITKLKIDGYNIKTAKINGSIVFKLEDAKQVVKDI